MKQKLFSVLLCASLVLASSLPAAAATELEEPEFVPSGPITYYEIPLATVKVVDMKGNPVLGLSISDAYTNIFTGTDGMAEIDVGTATSTPLFEAVDFSKPISFYAYNKFTKEKIVYNHVLDDNKVTTVVWDKETPTESLKRTKKKIQFRVVDQQDKPVKDANFMLPTQTFLIPTNKDGETWYAGEKLSKARVMVKYKDSKDKDVEKFYTVSVSDKSLKAGNRCLKFKVKI